MTQLDFAIFLVAGIVGVFGAYGAGRDAARWGWGGSLSWGIIAVWALLKLVRAI